MSALKKLATSIGISLSAEATDDQMADEIEKRFKAKDEEKASAMSASATAKTEAEKAKGDVTALSARVTTLEGEKKARDEADLSAAIGEVKTLAAAANKPEAFSAEDETDVKALWASNRPMALRALARAKATIGAPATALAGTKVVQPAGKAQETAQAATTKQNDRDTKIALAKASGHAVKVDGDKVTATRPDGTKIEL